MKDFLIFHSEVCALTPKLQCVQMGEKDIAEKVLADYNDVFSDIINVLLFNGERRVKEDSLVTGSLVSQYKADDSKLHEQERDVSKYWSEGKVQFALFGLEHQTKI